MTHGFIHKLESINAFIACHHPNSRKHSAPFLICDNCHNAVELEDKDVVAQLNACARALGFQPQMQTIGSPWDMRQVRRTTRPNRHCLKHCTSL